MSSIKSSAEKLLIACNQGPEKDALAALDSLYQHLPSSAKGTMQIPPACGDDTRGAMQIPPAPHQMMINAVNIRDVHGGMFRMLCIFNR